MMMCWYEKYKVMHEVQPKVADKQCLEGICKTVEGMVDSYNTR
jgi:hypothetical protein